ncbi:hypothetical protein IJH23_00165 [Candidatus Saccharibacteria bacterium]|nr:hypothetical protein [Candidatus Saccharibacteria bacterium]
MGQKNKKRFFAWGALAALILAVSLMIFAESRTVSDIRETAISKTPTAILASAGMSEAKTLSVPVSYFDQRADACVDIYNSELRDALMARQFEWTRCEYYNKAIEEGLAEFSLSKEYLPVAVSGELTPNREMDFSRWFSTVEGKSQAYAGILKMNYRAEGAEFSFIDPEFYPLDMAEFSDGDFTNEDGHNHLFTMNFAVPFSPLLSGKEEFSIEADDDTFVFVGDKLVLDMGGVHESIVGRFLINESGEIYSAVGEEELAYSGVKVSRDEGSIVRIFHADRDSSESVFNLAFREMNLNVMESKIAEGGASEDGGIQVAYDPSDPSYIAPLGESKVFQPDRTNGLLIIATIEGFAIAVLSILLMVVVRYLVNTKK